MQGFSKIYEKVGMLMNEWENHRTQTHFEDSLISKSFVFEMVSLPASHTISLSYNLQLKRHTPLCAREDATVK